MSTAPAFAPQVVAPTYQLLKLELAQALRDGGLLPGAASARRIESLYRALMDYLPAETPVTAVYMHEGTPVEVRGTVIAVHRSSNEEPSFSIAGADGALRDLPGSLLTRTGA